MRLALAKGVREADPPQADGLGRALRETVVFKDPACWRQSVLEYLDRAGRTDLAFSLASQGDVMLEVQGAQLGAMSEAEVGRQLVINGLRRWVDGRVWGPEEMLQALVDGSFSSPQEARRYQESCLDHAQIEEIASQLLSRAGREIRAPRTRAARPTTAEMLDEDVE